MKKITLFFILTLFSTAVFAQGKADLKHRGLEIVELVNKSISSTNEHADTPEETYAIIKLIALKDVFTLSKEEQIKLGKIFLAQYPTFKDAADNYAKSKSAAAKVELMKALVKNEEEFRSNLTTDQLLKYNIHAEKIFGKEVFDYNFMSNDKLMSYKKELE